MHTNNVPSLKKSYPHNPLAKTWISLQARKRQPIELIFGVNG
jgi:hypothetical protein